MVDGGLGKFMQHFSVCIVLDKARTVEESHSTVTKTYIEK